MPTSEPDHGTHEPTDKLPEPRKPLRAVEQAFLTAYTTPGKTLGNATRSYLAVRPHVTVGSAEALGITLLGKLRDRGDVQRAIEDAGIGLDVRVRALKTIVDRDTVDSETTYEDADGTVKQRVRTRSRGKASDAVAAARLLSELDGSLARAQATVDVQKAEYLRAIDTVARSYAQAKVVPKDVQGHEDASTGQEEPLQGNVGVVDDHGGTLAQADPGEGGAPESHAVLESLPPTATGSGEGG